MSGMHALAKFKFSLGTDEDEYLLSELRSRLRVKKDSAGKFSHFPILVVCMLGGTFV